MALYHCSVSIISRSGGKSAVGSIAYETRTEATDEETGTKLDYRKKGKSDPCLLSKRLIPKDCPEQFKVNGNWANLWNEVQRKENRKNSQFARDFNIALQKELTLEQNYEVIKNWFYENFKDVICDINIHAPHKNKDGTTNDNIHAHLMITTRRVDKNSPDGWGEKDRESNSKDFLKQARKSLADLFNKKFDELGIDAHIDHRTLEEQGIDREPQQHQGVTATALERKGKKPRRTKYKSQEQKRQDILVTEKELNAELDNDLEYKMLKLELKNIKDKERYADNLIKKYADDEETLSRKYMFHECSAWNLYVQNNADEERNFYKSQPQLIAERKNVRTLKKEKVDLTKEQLELLAKITGITDFTENFIPTEIKQYRYNTMNFYPTHHESIKTWFKDKADSFISGIKTVANKIGNHIANVIKPKKALQNSQSNENTKTTHKGRK